MSSLSLTGSSAPPASPRTLCDNTSYLLGADEKGKPERSRQCFEACAALHHKVLDGVDSPAAKAILAFLTAGSRIQPPPTRCWQSSGPT